MRRRSRTTRLIRFALLLVTAILVVANLFSYSNFYRFDATAQKRYSLTLGSQRMVCELSKDLQVDFYVTRASDATVIGDLEPVVTDVRFGSATDGGEWLATHYELLARHAARVLESLTALRLDTGVIGAASHSSQWSGAPDGDVTAPS